jgi:hypothetical protein
MIVVVEVDVATRRPPRADATITVTVEAPLREDLRLDRALTAADTYARETALLMAFCHPHVVMPVAARTVAITEV